MGRQDESMIRSDHRWGRSRSPSPRRKMDSPVSSWKLGETVEAENGLRFTGLTVAGGPIVLTLSGIAPFDPSSWQEESLVKNLDIRLDASTESKLECMQACIMERFALPKYKTDAFKPFLHKREEYPANLRVKVQTTGLTKTRFWRKDKKQTEAPECYAGATFEAKVLLKGIWYSEECWGASLQATDMMLIKDPPIPECPF
jgi:hypothetical protein